MKLIILLGVCMGAILCFAQEPSGAAGTLLITNFATAPFPHASRSKGHVYKTKTYSAEEHYSSNTVALYIPEGFHETGTVDCVVHFHGWGADLSTVLTKYKLPEQLQASQRNAVLIVPQGPYKASDSAGGKLEDPDGFKRFIAEALQVLRQLPEIKRKDFSLGKIILSGHSGGYQVISSILDHGGMDTSIAEVWLFDGLYAQVDRYLAWCRAHPDGRFLNIYTPSGGTVEETKDMMDRMKKAGDAFAQSEEAGVTPELLATSHRLFIFTPMAHDEVLAKRSTYKLFLETSRLSKRR